MMMVMMMKGGDVDKCFRRVSLFSRSFVVCCLFLPPSVSLGFFLADCFRVGGGRELESFGDAETLVLISANARGNDDGNMEEENRRRLQQQQRPTDVYKSVG